MDIRILSFAIVIIVTIIADRCYGDVVTLDVKHKFAGKPKNLSALKARDIRRHARFLSKVNVDIPLGGIGHVDKAGLYFAKLRIGNPPEEYHVHVDTGVDFSWVDCAECKKCARKSYLGIKLNKYDPEKSNDSSLIYCTNEFCSTVNDGKLLRCKSDQLCAYNATYPDNSGSTGHLVKDTIQLQQVTGNLQTGNTNETIIFGCGVTRSYGTNETILEGDVDGVLGFGQGNSSIISQLAEEGKVKRKFSHCLNNINGGGIFAIGEVEEPKMNKTSMIKEQYTIELREMQMGNSTIKLSRKGGTIGVNIDMGSSLAYLPTKIHRQVIKTITHRPSVKPQIVDNFTCFTYDKNVDDEFPVMKFIFADSLVLTVYPRDYLFKNLDGKQCIGWLRSENNDEGSHMLLGDMVLANKLVVYDIENQTIGWTDYNCSTNIIMKEENAGIKHSVGAHNIDSGSSFRSAENLIVLSALIISLHFSVA